MIKFNYEFKVNLLKFFGGGFMSIYAYGEPHDEAKKFVYDSLVNRTFSVSCGVILIIAI